MVLDYALLTTWFKIRRQEFRGIFRKEESLTQELREYQWPAYVRTADPLSVYLGRTQRASKETNEVADLLLS